MKFQIIQEQYGIGEDFTPFGDGHINGTFLSESRKYLLQKINTYVFVHPEQVMFNIESVTAFLREVVVSRGGDPEREVLSVIKNHNGELFTTDENGNVYRVLRYIDHTRTPDMKELKTEELFEAGRGFGRFQKDLSAFDASLLYETIPSFHDTVKRLETLKKAYFEDSKGRTKEVLKEFDQAVKWSFLADFVPEGIKNGTVPVTVTHNDTKVNNLLLDEKSGKALCVIDLDTVMPGTRIMDYGDALRIAGFFGEEDEEDISRVQLNKEAFLAYTKGYLEEMGDELPPEELKLFPRGIALAAYENGVRFLTDYLQGDVYFRIHYPKQNLNRVRAQFKRVEEVLKHEEELQDIVRTIVKEENKK